MPISEADLDEEEQQLARLINFFYWVRGHSEVDEESILHPLFPLARRRRPITRSRWRQYFEFWTLS